MFSRQDHMGALGKRPPASRPTTTSNLDLNCPPAKREKERERESNCRRSSLGVAQLLYNNFGKVKIIVEATISLDNNKFSGRLRDTACLPSVPLYHRLFSETDNNKQMQVSPGWHYNLIHPVPSFRPPPPVIGGRRLGQTQRFARCENA